MIDTIDPRDLSVEILRQLIDHGSPDVQLAAARRLPMSDLTAGDAELALRLGGDWAAACPAIPASQRPHRPERPPFGQFVSIPATARFHYPPPIAALNGRTFPAAPGWTISPPATGHELAHNAKVMRNCTAGLAEAIDGEELYLLIVDDPEGRRYNVAVGHEARRYWVGEINSRNNNGQRPHWLRRALIEWFRQAGWDSDSDRSETLGTTDQAATHGSPPPHDQHRSELAAASQQRQLTSA